VYQQGFYGIAGPRLLNLRVFYNVYRCFKICAGLHIDVAVTFAGLDNRNPCIIHHPADEVTAAPGDNHIYLAPGGENFIDLVSAPRIGQGDRVRIPVYRTQSPPYGSHQGPVGFQSGGAAPEQDCTTCLIGEAEGIDSNIGTGFVDDGCGPQGHGYLFDKEPVGKGPAVEDPANGVILPDHHIDAVDDFINPLIIQGKPVHQGFLHTGGTGPLHILSISCEDGLPVLIYGLHDCPKALVLFFSACQSQPFLGFP